MIIMPIDRKAYELSDLLLQLLSLSACFLSKFHFNQSKYFKIVAYEEKLLKSICRRFEKNTVKICVMHHIQENVLTACSFKGLRVGNSSINLVVDNYTIIIEFHFRQDHFATHLTTTKNNRNVSY